MCRQVGRAAEGWQCGGARSLTSREKAIRKISHHHDILDPVDDFTPIGGDIPTGKVAVNDEGKVVLQAR